MALLGFGLVVLLVYNYLEFFINLIVSIVVTYMILSILFTLYFMFKLFTAGSNDNQPSGTESFFKNMINKVKDYFYAKKNGIRVSRL
jgi:hypothetical protein